MDSVYIETSVISYLAAAPSRDLLVAAHQQVTREWWDAERGNYDLFISQMVFDEIAKGDAIQASRRLTLINGLTRLSMNDDVFELAQAFINESSLPKSAMADAIHIAVSTIAGVDFLMTWNCRHIANVHVLRKLTQIADLFGYELPIVGTPLQLSPREPEL